MKIWIVILCLCLHYSFLRTCREVFKCADKKLKDGKCLLEISDEETHTVLFDLCKKNEYCYSSNSDINTCVPRQRLQRYEKEKCNYAEECLSNICNDGKCGALADGSDCNTDKTANACSNKSFCNNKKKCQALIPEGEDCTDNDTGCDFPLICGKKEIDASNPTCIKMFSIEIGKYSPDPLLCTTGFSHYKKTGDGQYCASSSTSVETCEDDTNCVQKINFAESEEIPGTGSCSCSASGGTKGYCSITTDKEEWTKYLEVYKDFISESLDDDQNVQQLRKYTHGESDRLTWRDTKLIQATAVVIYYNEMKDADKCGIRYLTTSNSIKSSAIIILLIMIILA